MKKNFLNKKGQFFPFRLLIGAMLGLAILVIVLSIVHGVEDEKFRLSGLRFLDGFEAAVNLPTGDIVKQEKLFFKKGEVFTAHSLARQFGIADSDCINFYAAYSDITVSDNHKRVQIDGQRQLDVYFDCIIPSTGSCKIDCQISFGKEPPIHS